MFIICSNLILKGGVSSWERSHAGCTRVLSRPARPAQAAERLFFGLFPDAAISVLADRVGQRFVCENGLRGTRLKPERLHVSLHHVGDYKRLRDKFIYAAREAAKTVSQHPFEITFRFIKSFEGAPPKAGKPRRRPLVLLGEGRALRELHRMLGAAMKKYGLDPVEHFTPHMTLLYGPDPVAMQPIEPIRFVAREFVLVHSELWHSRYNIVDRWPLRG